MPNKQQLLFPKDEFNRWRSADKILLRTPFTIDLQDGLKLTLTLQTARMLRRFDLHELYRRLDEDGKENSNG